MRVAWPSTALSPRHPTHSKLCPQSAAQDWRPSCVSWPFAATLFTRNQFLTCSHVPRGELHTYKQGPAENRIIATLRARVCPLERRLVPWTSYTKRHAHLACWPRFITFEMSLAACPAACQRAITLHIFVLPFHRVERGRLAWSEMLFDDDGVVICQPLEASRATGREGFRKHRAGGTK